LRPAGQPDARPGPRASGRLIEKTMSANHQSDPHNRARLRWRSRRGLLENDILLTRFLDANEETMTDEEVDAYTRLMDLTDNDLMDLLLARKEPTGEVDLPQVHALLQRLRQA
jgi:antitoxin CptB